MNHLYNKAIKDNNKKILNLHLIKFQARVISINLKFKLVKIVVYQILFLQRIRMDCIVKRIFD